ncbi:hypothetical protein SteCoe_34519 [Stentor coeruleus]|uniref:Uncharacterized protein n=1 Tax=Stentor coeruleus TaxID=5963 RepID=A0A1R2AUE0_9CILI|nr:hypothetical protein SteCoe_34519 [Stentor coeruleus]
MSVENRMKNYNQNSSYQLHLAKLSTDLILQAISRVLNTPSQTYVLADYGCSEGLNSSILFKEIIGHIENLTESNFLLFFNDLPFINWANFFKVISSQEAFISKRVFSSAIGKSFGEQILPSNTLHFGFSSLAFHWLSEPVPKYTRLEFNHYNEENAQIGIRHYTRLLELRYQELVIGGQLIFITLTFLGEDAIYEFQKELFNQLHKKGLITEEEALNFKYPIYLLTSEQWDKVLETFAGRFKIHEKNIRIIPKISLISDESQLKGMLETLSNAFFCMFKDCYESVFQNRENKEEIIDIAKENLKEIVAEKVMKQEFGEGNTICIALEKIS